MHMSVSESDSEILSDSLQLNIGQKKFDDEAGQTDVRGDCFVTSPTRTKTTTTSLGGTGGGVGDLSSANTPAAATECTLVISNTSSCTLQLQSGSYARNKKTHSSSTYTVQFNREKTKTTKAAAPNLHNSNEAITVKQAVGADCSSEDDNGSGSGSIGVVAVMGKGRAAMTASPLSSSSVAAVAVREVGGAGSGSTASPTAQAGPRSLMNSASNATSRQIRSTTSKPCCFCWCCCCSCSWIRRRCLSVKTPNGSLETGQNDFLKDEELRNLSATEVSSWGDSFEQLMANEVGRKVFRSFLRCEYSEENILFWLACEELKKERSPDMVEEKARIIYEDYVSILSPREVSLDSRVREIINRNMIAPSQHTFDEAQLQIYTLMHRDSYPRFVNSPVYRNLLRTSGARVETPVQIS